MTVAAIAQEPGVERAVALFLNVGVMRSMAEVSPPTRS